MHQVIQAFPDVLNSSNNSEKDNGKEEGQGEVESNRVGDETNGGRIKLHIWLSLIEAVSDLTKYDFQKTFAMSVYEFFAFISYINYKRTKEKAEIDKFRRQNKI